MAIALWIVQVILAIKLLSVAYSHGLRPGQEKMAESIQRIGPAARPLHVATAILSLLGCLGLLLPAIPSVPVSIIPATAAFVCLLMVASIIFHVRSREKPAIFADAILAAMAAFVAFMWWVLASMD